jgi:hypothetical protein
MLLVEKAVQVLTAILVRVLALESTLGRGHLREKDPMDQVEGVIVDLGTRKNTTCKKSKLLFHDAYSHCNQVISQG